MALISARFLLIGVLLLGCDARENTTPGAPATTPLEVQLTRVSAGQTQPAPQAIQVEVTPEYIRVSLSRFADAWQQAAAHRDAQIIAQGPWWCGFLRERCLAREGARGQWLRFAPLPEFPKISLANGDIPDDGRKSGERSLYITPLLEQLHQARDAVVRYEMVRQVDPNAQTPRRPRRPDSLVVVADQRMPISALTSLIYTAQQAEYDRLFFRVDAPGLSPQAVPYLTPGLPYVSKPAEGDDPRAFLALPTILLRPEAVYIRLSAEKKTATHSEPADPRWDAQRLAGLLYPAPALSCGFGPGGQARCETVEGHDPPLPDWAGGMLTTPEADACELLRLTGPKISPGAITALLERYDKVAYYPGFVLNVADTPTSHVTLGTWLQLLAELQAIPAFRGVYYAPVEQREMKHTPPSCEHMILIE